MSLFSFLWEAMVFSFILVPFFPLRFSFLCLVFRPLFISEALFFDRASVCHGSEGAFKSPTPRHGKERERKRREKASEQASERAREPRATSATTVASALSPTKKKKLRLAKQTRQQQLVDQSRTVEQHVEATRKQRPEAPTGGGRQPAPPRAAPPERADQPLPAAASGGRPPPPWGGDEGPATPAPSKAPSEGLDSPTIRSAALAPGRGLGGGGGGGGAGGGVSPEALAAGLSRAAAALGGRQRPPAAPSSSQRRAPPSSAKEVRFVGEEQTMGGSEERGGGRAVAAAAAEGPGGKRAPLPAPSPPSPSRPPPSPSPPPPSVLADALQPLVSAAGEALPRTAGEVPVRLARGALGLARDLLPPPSLLPFRVPSAWSGASPTAPLQGFVARARAEGMRGLAADARSAAAQGSIRVVALAQPWLEGGAALAAAAWRAAEDVFAAAVGGVGEEDDDSEVEGQTQQKRTQPRPSAAASAAPAAAPQRQQQREREGREEHERRLPSSPSLERVAGLAFGLSLLWLVLGVPPAALLGVLAAAVAHSLAREGVRAARLRSGGGWAGGRMRRVARRIRRERSRAAAALMDEQQQEQQQQQQRAG